MRGGCAWGPGLRWLGRLGGGGSQFLVRGGPGPGWAPLLKHASPPPHQPCFGAEAPPLPSPWPLLAGIGAAGALTAAVGGAAAQSMAPGGGTGTADGDPAVAAGGCSSAGSGLPGMQDSGSEGAPAAAEGLADPGDECRAGVPPSRQRSGQGGSAGESGDGRA